MTYVRYNEGLVRLMLKIEPELKGRLSTKSFRIGATSDAYALNIEREGIGNMGRWALGSTAYTSYVHGLSRAERAVYMQKRISEGRERTKTSPHMSDLLSTARHSDIDSRVYRHFKRDEGTLNEVTPDDDYV